MAFIDRHANHRAAIAHIQPNRKTLEIMHIPKRFRVTSALVGISP